MEEVKWVSWGRGFQAEGTAQAWCYSRSNKKISTAGGE